jgi:hypothetical protein
MLLPTPMHVAARALRTATRDYSISLLQRRFGLGYKEARELHFALVTAATRRDLTDELISVVGAYSKEELDMPDLMVHTRIYPENANGGLLLCGVNHGYSKVDGRLDAAGTDRSDKYKSFFSDGAVNDYPFRNNVAKWLGMWGLPLRREDGGPLERSIVQTNWLQTCTSNVADLSVGQECIKDPDSFLAACEQLRPRLILFFSKELLGAFTSPQLRPRVQAIFGEVEGQTEWIEKPVEGAITFKIGRQRFARTIAISLPHATGARGITDSFIQAQDAVSAELAAWWAEHKGRIAPLS